MSFLNYCILSKNFLHIEIKAALISCCCQDILNIISFTCYKYFFYYNICKPRIIRYTDTVQLTYPTEKMVYSSISNLVWKNTWLKAIKHFIIENATSSLNIVMMMMVCVRETLFISTLLYPLSKCGQQA